MGVIVFVNSSFKDQIKMMLIVVSILIINFASASNTAGTHLSKTDIARLKNLFESSIQSDNLQYVYYGAVNLPNLSLSQKKNGCVKILDTYNQSPINDTEKMFYIIGSLDAFGCLSELPLDIKLHVKSSIEKDSLTSQELYFKFFALDKIEKIDEETEVKMSHNLQRIIKKDDSLNNIGYAFHIASALRGNGAFLLNWIENVIAQADEVNGEMLQFEGGLSITGLIVNGILKLVSSQKKSCPFTKIQVLKFATYFLSRHSVQTVKGASILIESLQSITQIADLAPVCINIVGSAQIASNGIVNFKIVDVLGSPLITLPQSISVTISPEKSEKNVILNRKAIQKSSDKTTFSVDIASDKLSTGLYVMNIDIDNYSHAIRFKILGRVKIKYLEIGVGEIDSTFPVKKHIALYPNKINEKLTVDAHQKIILRVNLVDEQSSMPISVHQAFVRFSRENTREEILFVAEQDSSKTYRFDMEVGGKNSPFNSQTGDYTLELIIGDVSLSNSFKWLIADFHMKFSQETDPKPNIKSTRLSATEIVHQFRQPDSRPPKLFSDIFSILCVAPLILLIAMWRKLNVNISNISINLCSIGFHVSIGSIFCLFFIFWLQLDMFVTMRYLLPMAIATFLTGNHMLKNIAKRKCLE